MRTEETEIDRETEKRGGQPGTRGERGEGREGGKSKGGKVKRD